MGEEHLTIDPSDRAVEQAIVALKKGAHLLKYGRRGKPKFYPLRLSADEKFLIWYSGEKENQLRLSSITNVIHGQSTVILQPEMASQCISLIYGNGELTLDLICKDKMQAETWFVGLRAVISRTHRHRMVDSLKSKRGAHSCISSPAGYMRRKQNLGLSAKTIRLSQVRSLAGSPTQSFSERCFTDGLSCSAESFFLESSLSNVMDNFTSCSSYFEPDNLCQTRASCAGTEIQTDMLAPLLPSSNESRPFGKNVLRDVFIWGEGAEGGCLGVGEVKLDALSPKLLESTVMLDVQAISIGRSHASIVTKQGEVFCWGEGKNGRLGHKHDMDTARPKLVDSLNGVRVKSVSCGEYQTCALTFSGELYSWGDNSFCAELVGKEKKRSHWLPNRVCGSLDGVKISSVACAEWHTAIVSTSGQLFTYGDGTFGVLGHGNLQSVAQPKEVESLRGLWVKCVACGPWHTAAVVEVIVDRLKFNNPGGKLFTWGDGDKGRLGHPGEETKLLPTCVAKLVDHDFIQVSCASTLTIALSSTGKVYMMGSAVHGQLGNPEAKDKSLVLVQGKLREEFITEISSGSYHVAVLTSRGSVYTWGKGANGQLGLGDTKDRSWPTLVESLRDRQVEHIACGSSTTAAICLHKSASSTDQSSCKGCNMSFGITRKKQNCYNCGLLFCRTCCSKKTPNASLAPDKTKAFRVCDPCFYQLQRIAQSSRSSKLENHSPRPLPITLKAVTCEKVERDEANTTSSRMMATKKYLTENNQCFDRRSANSLGESKQFSDPVTSLLDSFPRWGQVPCPKVFRRDYGQMRTQNPHMGNSLASASPNYFVEPKVAPSAGLTMEEDFQESDKVLLEEVCKLRTQIESLERLCETRKEKIQESQQKVEEAWSVAKEEVSKSKAAKEVIKALTSRLQAMSESFFTGAETNVQAIANVLQTTSTYSDSQNHISGHRIVVPLANAQLEDRNVDSLCGSPIVFSSTLRSFYNKENNVDSRSAEESCKESDHGQAGLRTSKVEWVEQYQLGVFITLTILPSGKKGLKRVRFSRKKFTEKEAKKWWEENQLSVYKNIGKITECPFTCHLNPGCRPAPLQRHTTLSRRMTLKLFKYALPQSLPIRFLGNQFKIPSRFMCADNKLDKLVDPLLKFPEDEYTSQEENKLKESSFSVQELGFLQDSILGPVSSKTDTGKFPDDVLLVINAIRNGNDGFGERTEKALRLFREKLNPGLVVDVLRNIHNPELGVKFFKWAGRQIGYVHNASAYDALLDLIGCVGVPQHFFNDIGKDDKEVLGKLLNVLIRKCCRNGLWNSALEELGRLKDSGYKPSAVTYNALVQVFLHVDRLETASLIYKEMSELNFKMDKHTINSFTRSLCKVGKWRDALDLIDKEEFVPDTVIYTNMISGLCEGSFFEEAMNFLNLMRTISCIPNTVTYQVLLCALLNRRKLGRVKRVLNLMISEGCYPGQKIFNSLVHAYCRTGDYWYAYKLLKKMDGCGCQPGYVVYNILIGGICGNEELPSKDVLELAENVYSEMLTARLVLNKVNVVNFARCLCGFGKYEDAFSVIKEMMSKGFVPDISTYTKVIGFLCNASKVDKAFLLFQEMKRNGIVPDVYTYTILIDSFCKSGLIQQARNWLNEMIQKGCTPNVVTYTAIIHAYLKQRKISDANELFESMLMQGCIPNVVTFTALIDGYCKAGHLEKACQIYARMKGSLDTPEVDLYFKVDLDGNKEPNVVTFGAMVDGLCKAHKVKEAHNLLDVMLAEGCEPNHIVYDALIDGFCKVGKLDDAQEIFAKMSECGYSPSIYTYSSLIDRLFKDNRLDLAVKVLSKMLESSCPPNVVIYTEMVDGLCKVGKIDEAYKLMLMMEEKGCHPNVVTYTAMIDGFGKTGKVNKCLELIESMGNKGCAPNYITYSVAIKHCCAEGLLDEALQLLEEMKQISWPKHMASHLKVIEGFRREYLVSLGILEDMSNNNFLPVIPVYRLLIDSYQKAGRLEFAVELLKEISSSSPFPHLDKKMYSSLIECLSVSNKIDLAFELYVDMTKKGAVPELTDFVNLIKGLISMNKWENALEISESLYYMLQFDIVITKYLVRRLNEPGFSDRAVEQDEKFFNWYSGEKENQLRLTSITNVIHSQSRVFCFLIKAETWFVGLRAIILRTHHHRIVDPLKSNRRAHSSISSRAGYMRRKQNLGLAAKTIRPSQYEFTPKASVSSTQSGTCLWSGEFGADFVKSLERLCESRNDKIQESQQKVEEAWSVVKEEASKSKAAKEIVKALTSRVTIL
ncbi:hypothetical protein RDI58_005465 [Solanum bulbocastanum]|uniref:Uncharacterized protein n=1 Tax=Solanum bulbocastanum TaxID=147425 RepID=A0AAN8TZB4_SOLBU